MRNLLTGRPLASPVLGMSLFLFSGEGGVWGRYFWEFVADLSGKRCLYGSTKTIQESSGYM